MKKRIQIFFFIKEKTYFNFYKLLKFISKVLFTNGWVHVKKSNKRNFIIMLRRLLTVDKSVIFFSTVA